MKVYIHLTAFLCGFITLSLELLGVRALAPYFGYSIYVFGSLIGLVLLALAAGYALGGFWSDKLSRERFFLLLLLGGVYIAGAAVWHTSILAFLGSWDLITGSFFASFLLFGFPMLVFASASPYLTASLDKIVRSAGPAAGAISAMGTVGSLAGTFMTSFFLLPYIGTDKTFLLNAVLGIIVPAAWLVFLKVKKGALAAILPLLIIFLPGTPVKNVIRAEDSAYAHLEVVDYGNFLGLRAERRSGGAYSVVPKSGIWDDSFMLYNLFALPPVINSAKSALLLGLGAGTLPLIHAGLNPDLRITGVEIDPKVISLGNEYFGLGDRKNIDRMVAADARPYLVKNNSTYDFIEMDIFRGGTEIPFYLATKEFFALTSTRLGVNGLLAMNIYDPHASGAVSGSIIKTIASVYPYVYDVPVYGGSHFILAAKRDLGESGFNRLNEIDNPHLRYIADYFKKHVVRVNAGKEGIVLTDDLAPLEKLYGVNF